MSLESLSALKSLVQVRESSANVQGDNLEKMNNSIQQTGTNEAQRVDQIHLEKAKAEYDKALLDATVKTLEKKLERDVKAETTAAITAIGVGAISTLSWGWEAAKDMGGHQKLGDGEQGQKIRDIDKNGAQVNSFGKEGSTGTSNYISAEKGGKDQSVILIDKNGNGTISGNIRTATISNEDITTTLKKNGLLEDNGNGGLKVTQKGKDSGLDKLIEKSGGLDKLAFSDLIASGNKSLEKAGKDLFTEKSHSILKSETDNLLSLDPQLSKVGGKDLVHDALKADGKLDRTGWEVAGDVGKSTINGLISIAQDTVPYIQALMAARERAVQTAIELEAAKQKQAAAARKLDELERIISNPGGDGRGNRAS